MSACAGVSSYVSLRAAYCMLKLTLPGPMQAVRHRVQAAGWGIKQVSYGDRQLTTRPHADCNTQYMLAYMPCTPYPALYPVCTYAGRRRAQALSIYQFSGFGVKRHDSDMRLRDAS